MPIHLVDHQKHLGSDSINTAAVDVEASFDLKSASSISPRTAGGGHVVVFGIVVQLQGGLGTRSLILGDLVEMDTIVLGRKTTEAECPRDIWEFDVVAIQRSNANIVPPSAFGSVHFIL